MAALIGSYSGYLVLSLLPPLLWLAFYLQEDRHPEPKRLVLLAFIGGMIAAIAAVVIEVLLFAREPVFPGLLGALFPALVGASLPLLIGVSLVEEYLKYFAVRFTVLSHPDFNEPVDAMIYMVTAALGFAALENVMFLVPVFEMSLSDGVGLTATRFFGANLLHALSSAIVGYFLARHHWSPWRKHAIALGIFLAVVLHTLFNYFIIIREAVPGALVLLIFLLGVMAVMVFIEFARLNGRWRGRMRDGPGAPSGV
jgi:RsiW-degrading membrane proteinase PrsW (M82 family)